MPSPIITRADPKTTQNRNRTADVTVPATPGTAAHLRGRVQVDCVNRDKGALISSRSSPVTRRSSAPSQPGYRVVQEVEGKPEYRHVENQDDRISDRRGQRHSKDEAGITSQPQSALPTSAPAPSATEFGTLRMATQTMPQSLRKKRSIMDRFRSLSKEPSRASTQPQPRQSVIYVPTHAASDFSRLVVGPRATPRQQPVHPYSEKMAAFANGKHLETIVAEPMEDEQEGIIAPKHHSSVLNSLTEAGPSVDAVSELSPAKNELQYQAASSSKQPGPCSPRHTHSPVTDPVEASHVVPAVTAPEETPNTESSVETVVEEQKGQPSDYEVFIARAEARERAFREQIMRGLSQDPMTVFNTYVGPYSGVRAETKAPFSYRRPMTCTTNISTTSTAVNGGHAGPSRRTRDGRSSEADSGIGSQSSGRRSSPEAEDMSSRISKPSAPQPKRHPSREPVPRMGRVSPPRMSAARQVMREVDDNLGARTAMPLPTRATDKPSSAPQQPRTLRRQASFGQMIGEYIKPTRQRSRYDAAENSAGLARIMEA